MRAALVAALLLAGSLARADDPYDIIIRNGRVIDGAGNPWYQADVAVRGDRIAAIGHLQTAQAKRVIDVGGAVVAPGFIDVHTHIEGEIRNRRTADNFVLDGVTTVVTGNCGGSAQDLPGFFNDLKKNGISLNVASLVGHGMVRSTVFGSETRAPTSEEQTRMEALVDEAMRAGAVGMSTGLIYVPGTYSKTPEIVGLARVVARHGGVYATHMRHEGDHLFEAVNEALEIGRQANIPVEISHMKVANKRLWGQSKKYLAMIDAARAEGLDVTGDQYPYTASSTALAVMVPSWVAAGGKDEQHKRLIDPPTRKKIAAEMKENARKQKRTHLDYAVVANCKWDTSLNGMNLSQVSKKLGRKARLDDEIQTVIDLVDKGGAQMVYHQMSEPDVARLMQHPHVMVASDGSVVIPENGVPHPRSYGTNARVLGRYVRELKVLPLEQAVRKMTSLPAQRFHLIDRGLVRPGLPADLVVFDPATVADVATFDKPHAYSRGFKYVLVNGEVVVEEGRHTQAKPGKVLMGPGFTP